MTKPNPNSDASLDCIIVDDENTSRETLKMLLQFHLPHVNVVAEADSIFTAQKAVSEHHFDILFLDINMPSGSGFSLLESLDKIDFDVIFVTAHEDYAIKAIRYSAMDYLLKPVDPELLKSAVGRCAENPRSSLQTPELELIAQYIRKRSYTGDKILLSTNSGYRVIDLHDIIRCEGEGSYTTIHLTNGEKILESKTLKYFESLFDSDMFFRSYQSHLINLSHITEYKTGRGGTIKMSDHQELKVSREKKKALIDRMKRHFTTG